MIARGRRSVVALAIGASIALSGAACGDGHAVVAAEAPAPSSRAALVNALSGTWQATLSTPGSAPSPGSLTLAVGPRRGQVGTACGNYDVTAASLRPSCVTSYSLMLNGTLTTGATDGGASVEVPFSGAIDCWSPRLDQGQVFFTFDDGSTADLSFDTAAGFSNGALRPSGAGLAATLDLRRGP